MFVYGFIVPGHINNLYNTVFWTLVKKGGLTTIQAEDRLKVRANTQSVLTNVWLDQIEIVVLNNYTQAYINDNHCVPSKS